jgi:hypothetical protein
LIEIVLKQCGHSFVVGSAGAAGAGAFFMLFAAFTIRKTIKATMMKSTVACRKDPQLITTVPMVVVNSLKLTPPSSSPTIGMIMSLTREVMIFPNAPAMMTATARSSTLPRMMKALNSFNMIFSLIIFEINYIRFYVRNRGLSTILGNFGGVDLFGTPQRKFSDRE